MSGGAYFDNAGIFLVETAFGFYILIVMLRFLLQWVRADFYNPLVQFIVTLTNPVLLPLRRYVPGLMGLDMAAVVLMLVLRVVEFLLIFAIVGRSPNFGGLLVLSIAALLGLLITVLTWAIIIYAIMSWVNPSPRHPAVSLLRQLTEPLLRPARNLMPPVSGLDLTPILVLVGLQLTNILLITPLTDLGYGLALG